MHLQMCNLALIQNQYAPPNVESALLQLHMHHLQGLEPDVFSM